MHGILAYTFLNIFWKIHQFLSSINRDVHERKLVPLILLHGVVRSIRGIKAFPRFITPPAITFRSRCGQAARLPVKTTCAGHSLNHRRSFRAALRTLGGRAGTTQHLVCQTSNRTDHCCREPGSPAPCSPRRTLSGSKVNIGWSRRRRHQLSSRSLCVSVKRSKKEEAAPIVEIRRPEELLSANTSFCSICPDSGTTPRHLLYRRHSYLSSL